MDLLDFFRGLRPWRQLARYLNQLQRVRTSRFVIAQANDEELALVAARYRRDNASLAVPKRYRPPAEEWGTEAELLAAMLDRLGEMEAMLGDLPVATDKKGKPIKRRKPPKRYPRPETAIERAEQLLAEEHVADIIADVESSYVSEDDYTRMVAAAERQPGEGPG